MPAGYWCMLGKVPDSTVCFSIWHSWPGMTAAAPERKRDRECVVGMSGCRLSVFRVRFRRMFPVSDMERQQKWARVGLNKARFVWESQRQRERASSQSQSSPSNIPHDDREAPTQVLRESERERGRGDFLLPYERRERQRMLLFVNRTAGNVNKYL